MVDGPLDRLHQNRRLQVLEEVLFEVESMAVRQHLRTAMSHTLLTIQVNASKCFQATPFAFQALSGVPGERLRLKRMSN